MDVKICGLTQSRDVVKAVALGATHVGCVVVPGTPRAVSAETAGELLRDSGAAPVLVMRDASVALVLAAVEDARIATVQLHRFREDVATPLEEAGLVVHRVFDALEQGQIAAALEHAAAGRDVLLDVGGGGSGRTFDWTRLRGHDLAGVTIAGGITPENVGDLLAYGPARIDVGSGVESSPGKKDHRRLDALFEAIDQRQGGPA